MTRFAILDAFTDTIGGGNPAAVVTLAAPAPVAWMQRIAAEFNLAETAFVWPDGTTWRIRWFTPAVEVALCGHATLASAAWLWASGACTGERIVFASQSGALPVTRSSGSPLITLDFPALLAQEQPAPHTLIAAVRAPVRRSALTGASGMDWLIEVADQRTVAALQPDLAAITPLPVRGVIVTAQADGDSGWDVVSRFFAPAVGIPEDPVTGSAHCALTPWWASRLGRSRLTCRQLSRRGGTLITTLAQDRVHLAGSAVIVADGNLRHSPESHP